MRVPIPPDRERGSVAAVFDNLLNWHMLMLAPCICELDAVVGPLAEQTTRWCTAAFGQIARLASNVPTRLALHYQIDASLGYPPSNTWKRRPGRLRNRWLDLVWQNWNCSAADLWRRAVLHGAGTTLRPSPTIIIIIIIIVRTMIIVLSSWLKSFREFTRFIWWM